MGGKGLYLVLAGFLGAGAAVVPSLAAGDSPPASGSFTAVDFAWQANGGQGNTVTIQSGGTVDFGYPSGSSEHNADFGSGPEPSNCVQSAGASSGSVPPVPHQPTASGWSGSCTFDTPGTYTFHCDLHSFMTGTVVVQGSGTTTTTPPPTTSTTTSPTTPPTTTSPSSPTSPTSPTSPLPAAATPKASVKHNQRGHAIRGSVAVPATYAGGSFEVDVFRGTVRIGRLVRRRLAQGVQGFSVPLRGMPRGHRRLTLAVKVGVRAPQRPTKSARFVVLLRI